MTEARIAREAVIVAHSDDVDEAGARIARVAELVAHHFPEALTNLRNARGPCLVVAISRPHGYGIHDDPPL